MQHDHVAHTRMQNGMRDARTHVNRQKSRHGIEPPRTIAEQQRELETLDEHGRRRRDPVRAARAQHVHRDNGVGGAWIDVSQRANDAFDDIFFEKLPDRHERNARRRSNS